MKTVTTSARPKEREPVLPPKSMVVVPDGIIATRQQQSLLQGLMAVAAGFSAESIESLLSTESSRGGALFLYCVKGYGWCEIAARLHPVRPGDFLLVPSGLSCPCGARPSDPWNLHWVKAVGTLLPDYLDELSRGGEAPVLHVGEDPQLIRLFHETLRSLQSGTGLAELLKASAALAHLLAIVIEKRTGHTAVADADSIAKVAEAIIFMSEHLEEPVRVSALARSASLSPAYFSELFKQQTGCAPRDYLHLLRIHRACHLLRTTALSVKQVAASLGYRDPFHFSRQFKAFQGQSPSEYRSSRPE